MQIVKKDLAQYSRFMAKKKRTKPPIPLGYRKAAALWLAQKRAHKYETKYATLWEAAKDFIKTKLFRKITRSIKKQMVAKHGEEYFNNFIDLKDKQGRTVTPEDTWTGQASEKVGNKRQMKFVLNMFRDIKKDDDSKYPKTLHQIKRVFTPPKEIIYGKAALTEKVLPKDWVNNMVSAMKKNEFFRWESGIRSKEYLNKIFEVCRLTPKTKHLLHTAETTVLKQIRPTDVPENMLIRLMLYQTTKGTTPNEIKWPWTFLVDERTEKERQEEEAEELKATKPKKKKSIVKKN